MTDLQPEQTEPVQDRAEFLSSYRSLLRQVRQKCDDPGPHLELARFLIRHHRYGKAFSSLRVARALQPRRTETHYLIGWIQQKEGRTGEAKSTYEKILEIDPGDPRAYFNLGKLLEGEHSLEEAISAFKRAVTIEPGFADAYVRMASLCRQTGDIQRAIEFYRVLKDLKPESCEIPFEMGRCYQALGLQDRAILALEASLALKPTYLPPRLLLAEIYIEGKAFPQAKEILEQVVREHPRTAETYLLFGKLHLAENRVPQALASLLQLQKLHPEDVRGYLEMGRTYMAQSDHEAAEKELERARELAPRNLEVHEALAQVYRETGNGDKAVRHALLQCERHPDDPSSFVALADVHEDRGDLERALDAINRAVARGPGSDSLLCHRARIHVQAGHYNEAIADFHRAREINPENREAQLDTETIRGHKQNQKAFELFGRGREAVLRGDSTAALSSYRKVLELVPDNVNWLREMLDVFMSLGQLQDGAEILDKLLELIPEEPGLARQAATFHYQLGSYEQAFRLFENAVGRDPEDVVSRIHVIRSLAHRFLDGSLSPDRYPAFLSAYKVNLKTASEPDLARLELGFFHVTVSHVTAAGREWVEEARTAFGGMSDPAGTDLDSWRLRGLFKLALLERDEAARLEVGRQLAESAPSSELHVLAYLEALTDADQVAGPDLERARALVEQHRCNGYLRSLEIRLCRKQIEARTGSNAGLRSEIRRRQQVVSQNPEDPAAFLDLGLALRYLSAPGEWLESSRRSDIAFSKAASLDETNPWPWWGLVRNAAGSPDGEQKGSLSRLASIGQKGLRRFPSMAVLHHHIGAAHIDSDDVSDRERGLRELICATALSPEMAPAHLSLARHYRSMEQNLAAHHHYLHVLESLPGGRHAPEVLDELSRLI